MSYAEASEHLKPFRNFSEGGIKPIVRFPNEASRSGNASGSRSDTSRATSFGEILPARPGARLTESFPPLARLPPQRARLAHPGGACMGGGQGPSGGFNPVVMMSKFLSPVIILFWLIMTGLLVKREIIPALPTLVTPSYKTLLKNKSIPPKSKMGIYLFGRKIGYSLTTVTQRADGFYRIENKTRVKLPSRRVHLPSRTTRGAPNAFPSDPEVLRMKGGEPKVVHRSEIKHFMEMDGYSLVKPDYQLDSFDLSVMSELFRYKVTGQVTGEKLEVTVYDGKTVRTNSVKFQPRATTSNGLSPFLSMPHLSVGKEWSINLINPVTLQFETVKAYVESQDIMEWQGAEYEVYEVVLDYKGFQPRAWITSDGLILKEEILMPGFYLIRE